MASYPLNRLDDLVGESLERGIRAHHVRRLRRHGSAQALDPAAGGWAGTASFSPRPGCRVELLADGSEALARIADAIRSARSHVHLAGWHFDHSFRLEKEGPTLRELLADAADRVAVRVLAWAGAPLPLFHPARREVRQACEELAGGTRISMALDARERPFHCHHEKLVVVDDEVAFVGGIDLTGFGGDRLDSSAHPRRDGLGWHDSAVRLEGPIVADVARHFLMRWHAVAGSRPREPEAPAQSGGVEAQLVRTVPERVYEPCRDGEWSILESYLRAVRAAERLVYLESQFLWSPEITFELAREAAPAAERRLPGDRASSRPIRTTAPTTAAARSGC